MKEIKASKLGRRFELDEQECTELFTRAKAAIVNTYPEPGEGYSVALMTELGHIYDGASYKSDTYTLTMHSEATALAHAAINGEKDIVAMTGPNCHICKQLLYESALHSGIDITIIIEESGGYEQIPISDLMPHPWPEK